MQFLISLKDSSPEFVKENDNKDLQTLPNYNAYEVLAHSSACFKILEEMADQKPFSAQW